MAKIWLQKHDVSLDKKVQLLDSLVLSVMFYNSSCWGLRKVDSDSLDSFHRQLLKKICNIFYLNTISSKKLYKLTKTRRASIRVMESRWKFFGHALRLPKDTPPQQSMSYYFTNLNNTKFRGAKRTTIVTTLQADIKRAKDKFQHFQINSLECIEDLIKIRQIASDRKLWRTITKSIINAAEAEYQDDYTSD